MSLVFCQISVHRNWFHDSGIVSSEGQRHFFCIAAWDVACEDYPVEPSPWVSLSMNIRIFSKTDSAAVIQLWEACGLTRPWNDPAKDIGRKLLVQPDLFLVGELDKRIIASAMAGYDGHRGSVYYLAVAPAQQGKGYGQMLMQKIEILLIEKGCPKLNIVVRTSNEGVLSFYNRLGYTPDDVVSIGKRLIPDGTDQHQPITK